MTAHIFKKDFDEAKVETQILEELEPRMDYEIEKIKAEQTKVNLREFEMLFTQLKHW